MATKYICDRCNSEANVGRAKMDMAVSQPHKAQGLPGFDADLCADCLKLVCSALVDAIGSTIIKRRAA